MSKFLNLIVVVLSLSFVSEVHGLRCWTCSKAITNDECNARGKFKECPKGQVCVNRVVSQNDGSSYEISKGCRPGRGPACRQLNDRQNVGTYPMHCQYKGDSSRCECCCNTETCNWPHMECKDVATCRKPDPPGNGKIKCPSSITFGSKCTVKCNKGYKRDGPKRIVCSNQTSEGQWTPQRAVACLHSYEGGHGDKAMVCKPKIKKPEHGSVVCENTPNNKDRRGYNFIGSSCAFKCDSGYFRQGQETTWCLPGGQWSTSAPECKKGTCQAPAREKNRKDDCSDKNNFDSTCVMSCKKGYKLEGSAESTCQPIDENIRQGRWTNEFPKCVKAECRPHLMAPSHGAMDCTQGNMVGSICSFYCDNGYDLVDTPVSSAEVECVDGPDGLQWSPQDVPKCKQIMCERLDMPENGIVTCVGDGRVGSSCLFSCSPGYDLLGVAKKTQLSNCTDDGDGDAIGTWSIQGATCAPVRCEPERTAPENGNVYCTNGNNIGTICTFTCEPEYDMDDTASQMAINICEADDAGDGIGKWNALPPTCSTRYACDLPQVDPEHGSVSCSDESYLGSVCEFACEDGYELQGIARVSCRDLENDGDSIVEWSDSAPTCIVSTCPEQWYDSKSLEVICSFEKMGAAYPVGTLCSYECTQPGTYLEYTDESGKANNEISCIRKNTWSRSAAPRCLVKRCSRLGKIKNGNQPKCTNGNKFNSVCTFKCDSKYTLSHSDSLVCDGSGKDDKSSSWDKTPPACVLSECLKVPKSPSKGSVECSSGAAVGSYCTLSCSKGYAPKVNRVDCVLTDQTVDGIEVRIPKFQLLNDFCCAQCRSDFRFVQMVDGRFDSDLRKAIDFTKIFVTQLAGLDNKATFSTFLYNDDVKTDSVIKSTSASNSEAVAALFSQMQKWEIEEEGKKSDTSAALKYVNDVMFATLDNDVANFLLVIADDAPAKVSGTIRKLQQRGIHVFVVAGNNYAKIKWERIIEESGSVMVLDTNALMKRVYEVAFRDGCSNLAKTCA